MIFCCLTTFNPDIGRLKECFKSIIEQVDRLVVVDNNSINKNSIGECCRLFGVPFISLSDNVGIAKAQNIVWLRAIDENAEFIVFSDQDTIFPRDSIRKLAIVLNANPNCAAAAPVFCDKNSTRPVEVTVNIFEKKSNLTLGPTESRIVSHVISSGMLVRNSIAKQIGLNREDLFIDWVDTEWCWRARLNGHEIIQTGSIILEHILGEDRINLGKMQLTRHKLFRSYYKIRNAILISRSSSNAEIRSHLLQHTIKNIFFAYFSQGTIFDKSKIVVKAIWDGVLGKGGRYE